MRNRRIFYFISLVLWISVTAVNLTGEKSGSETAAVPLQDNIVKTAHRINVGSTMIGYDAYAGTMVVKRGEEKAAGSFFFISYVRKGDTGGKKRPILFSFNGGPGSSSVWLHLGLLGPKRVLLNGDGSMPPPPYRLVDNRYSLLDIADLVFIDPVSTGFSRSDSADKEAEFHGVSEDIASVGDFIRLYLTRFGRWTSPKFLIGESYGTTRAAGLSGYLQGRHGVYLNGIILVSSVLDHQTLRFNYGNDLPYILFLPSYTATAWYHGKLGEKYKGDLQPALKDSETFALGEYATALLAGDRVSPESEARIVRKLAELTSLSEDFIKGRKLRITAHEFFLELLKDTGEKTGRLDSRFKRFNGNLGFGDSESFFSDPSYSAIQGQYTETLNNYLSTELKFKSDLVYEIITRRIKDWRTGTYNGRYVNVADTLGKAMIKNPFLKIFVASGYYDLATPYFATKYTFDHLFLPEQLRKNISFRYYDAGHMMYIRIESLEKLRNDLKEFFSESLNRGEGGRK